MPPVSVSVCVACICAGNDEFLCLSIYLVPSISVTVTDNGSSPLAGIEFSLTCVVSGAEVASLTWKKDGVTVANVGSILRFSPLDLSDSGIYSCHIKVNGTCELSDKKIVTVEGNYINWCLFYIFC